MTVTNATGSEGEVAVDHITVVIDGVEMRVPKGTLVIRAAEQLGIEIPRFCDHPLLDPVAACRACLIEIEGMPKPQPACAQVLSDGMVVHTQHSSEVARLAQEGVMEFLLLNHPLDCPVCDKGGECPLQNQAMSVGRPESRFTGEKRTFPKPINVSAQILLDRERCVSCARCTRFADQIAGDADDRVARARRQAAGRHRRRRAVRLLLLRQHRADLPGRRADQRGIPVPLAPVRPRVRPRAPASTARRAARCAPTTAAASSPAASRGTTPPSTRSGTATRAASPSRTRPAVASSPPSCARTASCGPRRGRRPSASPRAGSAAARGRVGVLVGGRSTVEDAYAYARFARAVLGTDDIDFRARLASAEETAFLASAVAGSPVHVSYDALESRAGRAAGRLRARGRVADRLPAPAQGRAGRHEGRLRGRRRHARPRQAGRPAHRRPPGDEAAALAALDDETRALLAQPGAVILVGERIAGSAGAASAVVALAAHRCRARLGARAARASAARWTPVPWPGCCPVAVRSPTRRRAPRSPPPGTSTPRPAGSAGVAGADLLEAAARGGRLAALVVGGVELDATSPIRGSPSPRSRAPASSCPSRTTTRPSPRPPTSCCRWPWSPRSPAPS